MIKLIIEIEESSDDPRHGVNVFVKTEKERPTRNEDSIAQHVSPALRDLVKGLFPDHR